MGRTPCCSKLEDLNRGAWTADEDRILTNYIRVHGENGWRSLPKKAGLKRCGKSCRLRWLNYLRPEIKRGNITPDEEELIIRMHRLLGNRWALIAGRLPGRTDNEIKNYWNTHLSKKIAMSSSDALNSTSHLPLRKSISFSGMEEDSPRSQNSNEDDGAKPWEIRWASDNDISSGVLAGMHASVGGEQDASRSWAQLLEESLMADDDAQVDEKNIISPSELNVSDPLEYFNPFSLPFIDFGMLEDFSMERLLQPESYGFEDMRPLDNTHNNVDYAHCLSMEAEQGIADTSEQREVCSEQEREVGFDPLDYLSYHEEKWEDQVDLSCHIKSNEEEYLDILVDTPNKTGLG